MAFLKKLFGSKERPKEEAPPAIACPHVTLVPRWDNVEDMGIEARATGFTCDACQVSFTPAEASALRRTEVDRLNEIEGGAKAD